MPRSARKARRRRVYKFSVPRKETIHDSGMTLSPAMGMITTLNLQPTSGGRAVINGDFVMTANEVQPVLRGCTKVASRSSRCTTTA
ncbi:DUF1259 domain-containing protein [Saccharopolyspora hattusasensis]|uniref:DUF1259 domain-containing protein n=1 Tax=Saccharopolyspora hattusasensis TaxID=1128679 RepID=UPI003D95A769